MTGGSARDERADRAPAAEECPHCGRSRKGHATVRGLSVCHGDPMVYPDCYRRITVYGERIGALREVRPLPKGVKDIQAPGAEQVTLATLRDHAERALDLTGAAEVTDLDLPSYRAGTWQFAREVLAILDANGRPPGEPVIMPSPFDEEPTSGRPV